MRSFASAIFTLVSFLLVVGCNPVKSTATAKAGLADFHKLYDAKDYETIYATAHADLQNSQPKEDLITFLRNMRERTGPVKSTRQVSWNANSYNLQTEIVLTQETEFENGPGTETFTFRIKDDQAYLRGWFLRSPLLLDPSLQKPSPAPGESEEATEEGAEPEA